MTATLLERHGLMIGKCVKTLGVVLQEVLACGVLLPLINQLSDPDYINQFVIWMVSVGAPVRRR